MNNKKLAFGTLAIMTLMLAACGSSNPLGSIFGGSPTNYPTTNQSDLYGTVNSVDTSSHRIDLAVNDNNGTRNKSVYYDSRTQVTYQNQQGSPSQLERGDQVSVRLVNNGNGQLMADTITVTQSMSSSGNPGNTYPPTTQTASLRGTVNFIDTSARRIDVTTSYVNGLRNTQSGGNFSIYYDSRTRVMYQGRSYSPSDLERGDQVDVTTYNSNNGQYLADTITVTRNVRQ